MKDYEIQIAVKNAPLLNMMRENGYETAAELSRACGVSQNSIGDMLNLKKPLYTKFNQVNGTAQKIADFFKVLPDMLYPEGQHFEGLSKNKASVQVEAEQMFALTNMAETDPEMLLEHDQMIAATNEMINGLTCRQQKVLKMRFVEEKTLEECAQELSLNRERIRQIQEKALRIMRHPTKSEQLRQFIRG
jgi:RNA polymerase sigma factor (sigma-70 family)